MSKKQEVEKEVPLESKGRWPWQKSSKEEEEKEDVSCRQAQASSAATVCAPLPIDDAEALKRRIAELEKELKENKQRAGENEAKQQLDEMERLAKEREEVDAGVFIDLPLQNASYTTRPVEDNPRMLSYEGEEERLFKKPKTTSPTKRSFMHFFPTR